MGACDFYTEATGKTATEAYRNACQEAAARNGHQDGYSGDIQTSCGFQHFELPKGVNAAQALRWAELMQDAARAESQARDDDQQADWDGCQPSRRDDLRKRAAKSRQEAARTEKRVPAAHRALARRIHETGDEKRGRAVCIEITGKAKSEWRKRHTYGNQAPKRGLRLFVFCGTAAC